MQLSLALQHALACQQCMPSQPGVTHHTRLARLVWCVTKASSSPVKEQVQTESTTLACVSWVISAAQRLLDAINNKCLQHWNDWMKQGQGQGQGQVTAAGMSSGNCSNASSNSSRLTCWCSCGHCCYEHIDHPLCGVFCGMSILAWFDHKQHEQADLE